MRNGRKSSNYYENSEAYVYEDDLNNTVTKLKLCMGILILIASLKLLTLQYLQIILDILSCIMIFFTYRSQSKCLAYFSILAGLSGIIWTIFIGFNFLSYLDKSKVMSRSSHSLKDNNHIGSFPNSNITFTSTRVYEIITISTIILDSIVYAFVVHYSYKAVNLFVNCCGEIDDEDRLKPCNPDSIPNLNYGGFESQSNSKDQKSPQTGTKENYFSLS